MLLLHFEIQQPQDSSKAGEAIHVVWFSNPLLIMNGELIMLQQDANSLVIS
jgi:hypothetical protein